MIIDLRGVEFSGRILDIGGGGEGVVARYWAACGNNSGDVVVIDNRADELEESPDFGIKIIMDARKLMFLDNSFDNITCFFSLMYMDEQTKSQFLDEAYRVLKPNGVLWLWDTSISEVSLKEIFIVNLDIILTDQQRISTGYGVTWNKSQSSESISALCANAGFSIVTNTLNEQCFFIKAIKKEV